MCVCVCDRERDCVCLLRMKEFTTIAQSRHTNELLRSSNAPLCHDHEAYFSMDRCITDDFLSEFSWKPAKERDKMASFSDPALKNKSIGGNEG